MCLSNPNSGESMLPPPQFPPSKKAEEYSKILEYVMIAHFIVAIIKIVLGGLNAGTGDFFSCLILWCGYSRYDYCQTITYMIMCLQDVFMLGTSLGFWFQKNYHTDDTGAKEGENNGSYAFLTNSTLTQKASRMEKPTHKTITINIVVILSVFFICFYSVAIFFSFRAYREFKGVIEDNIGGPAALKQFDAQQNPLGYGFIPQEDPDAHQQPRQARNNTNFAAQGFGAQNNIRTMQHGYDSQNQGGMQNPFSGQPLPTDGSSNAGGPIGSVINPGRRNQNNNQSSGNKFSAFRGNGQRLGGN